MKFKITLLLAVSIFVVSCSSSSTTEPEIIIEETPEPSLNLNIFIDTKNAENNSYLDVWQVDLFVKINNISDSTFFTYAGDAVNNNMDQERLFYGIGGSIRLEKINSDENIWEPVENTSQRGESFFKMVPITPSKEYNFFLLEKRKGYESLKGRYRIRVDYFDVIDPSPTTVPYCDYSNEINLS